MEHPDFDKDQRNAEHYAGQPNKIRKVIEKAMNKLKGFDIQPVSELAENVKTLTRFLETYLRGHYHMPWKSAASVIAALLYFIAPTDAIPDFIIGFGYIDDVSVIHYTMKIIAKDLEKFAVWEQQHLPPAQPS